MTIYSPCRNILKKNNLCFIKTFIPKFFAHQKINGYAKKIILSGLRLEFESDFIVPLEMP